MQHREGRVFVFDDAFEHEVWQERGMACTEESELRMNTDMNAAATNSKAGVETSHPIGGWGGDSKCNKNSNSKKAGWRLVLVVDIYHPNATLPYY
jgi:hypothetical protein